MHLILPLPITLADCFVATLETLYRAVAARYRSAGWTIPMIHLICNRIRRAEQRVLKLLLLFQAGLLPAETAAVPRTRSGTTGEPGTPRVKTPRYFGWLLVLVPCDAANLACQLRLELADPQMQALLAASAKARRAMKTLGHMLMIEPELIEPKVVAEDGTGAEVAETVDAAVRSAGPDDAVSVPAAVGCHSASHPAWGRPSGQGPPLTGAR